MLTEVDAIPMEQSLNATIATNGFIWSHRDDQIIDYLHAKSSNSLQLTPIHASEEIEHADDNFMLCMEEPEEVLRSSNSDISGITSVTHSGHITLTKSEYFITGKGSDDCISSFPEVTSHPLQFVSRYNDEDEENSNDEIDDLEEDNLEMRIDEYNYQNYQSSSDSIIGAYGSYAGSTQEQLEALMESLTDPVGKYMRRRKLTAQEAIEIGIDRLLLKAPRKVREKYGPRRSLTQKQRDEQLKERNRCHAKATRMRRRLFRLIDARVDKHRSSSVSSKKNNTSFRSFQVEKPVVKKQQCQKKRRLEEEDDLAEEESA